MLIVDKTLEKGQQEGNPIRVGMVGAGMMGRGIALWICTAAPGMVVVEIVNHHRERAERTHVDAGMADIQAVETLPSWRTQSLEDGRP